MFLLYKLLGSLTVPLGWVLWLIAATVVLIGRGRQTGARVTALLAFLIVLLGSLPAVSGRLMHWTEAAYPTVQEAYCEKAQAIVLLGGALRPAEPSDPVPRLATAGDRVWVAARLYRAGCAPMVFVSAGGMVKPDRIAFEADGLVAALADFGVPAAAIASEHLSRTTHENALQSAAALHPRDPGGIRRILLVTSGFHLRRAIAEFEGQGFEVLPAPAERALLSPDLPYVPDAEAFYMTNRVVKEWVGTLLVRVRP
jgi:uncharacterized SAM-binding protein YcdF (DUF218 family)